MKSKKLDHPNQAIKCTVNTCHYYMNGDYCAAEQIQVEPKNAKASKETDCATFIPE